MPREESVPAERLTSKMRTQSKPQKYSMQELSSFSRSEPRPAGNPSPADLSRFPPNGFITARCRAALRAATKNPHELNREGWQKIKLAYLRRRAANNPAKPTPISAQVPGSGVGVTPVTMAAVVPSPVISEELTSAPEVALYSATVPPFAT